MDYKTLLNSQIMLLKFPFFSCYASASGGYCTFAIKDYI